jgi:transcriptional antiterminator RfaH
MADQCRWFAARHKAQQATWALLNLQHQGFVTHWPTFPERIVRRNKVISIRRPVFPGYIFILFSLSDRKYLAINSTPGVVRLLPMRTERPAPLPAGFVEGLPDQEFTLPALAEHIAGFARDEVVRVLSGPFWPRSGASYRARQSRRVSCSRPLRSRWRPRISRGFDGARKPSTRN